MLILYLLLQSTVHLINIKTLISECIVQQNINLDGSNFAPHLPQNLYRDAFLIFEIDYFNNALSCVFAKIYWRIST